MLNCNKRSILGSNSLFLSYQAKLLLRHPVFMELRNHFSNDPNTRNHGSIRSCHRDFYICSSKLRAERSRPFPTPFRVLSICILIVKKATCGTVKTVPYRLTVTLIDCRQRSGLICLSIGLQFLIDKRCHLFRCDIQNNSKFIK